MKDTGKKRAKKSLKRQIKSCTAGLLSLLMLLCLSPKTLAAKTDAETGVTVGCESEKKESNEIIVNTDVSNLYVLQVVTGSVTTDAILYFCVRYQDDTGVIRMEYIFPQYGELGEGYEKAVSVIHAAKLVDEGYLGERSVLKTTTQAEYGLAEVKRWGYSLESYQKKTPLQPLEKNEFLFEPRFTLSKVVSIDVMCRYEEKGTLSWPCQSMAIYRVDQLYDLGMVGHFSDQYYLDYTGTCVAMMVQYNQNGISEEELNSSLSYNFAWGATDTLFRVEARDDNDRSTQKAYQLITSFDDAVFSGLKTYDSHDSTYRYFMKMDIADEYGAGVEALAAKFGAMGTNSWQTDADETAFDFYNAKGYTSNTRAKSGWMYNQGFCEVLAVEVSYLDKYGNTCCVSVPAVLSFLDWALTYGNFDSTVAILGLLQQGESFGFDAMLPNMASLTEVRLRFGSNGAKSSVGLNGSAAQESSMAKESMAVTGMTIYHYDITHNLKVLQLYRNIVNQSNSEILRNASYYVKTSEETEDSDSLYDDSYVFHVTESSKETGKKNDQTELGLNGELHMVYNKEILDELGYDDSIAYAYAVVDGGFIRIKTDGDPIYYYTCSSTSGQTLTQSTVGTDQNCFKVPLSEYTGRESLEPRYSGDYYLLVLQTDTMEAAGTTSDFQLNVHYRSIDGYDKSTEAISVKTAVQSYTGYWPGKDGDASFTCSASAGNALYCVISAKNVSYFTGMTIEMEPLSDDYQLAAIKIYELTKLGKRDGRWENVTTQSGAVISDRVFTREYNKDRDISPTLEESVLFQSGEKKTITFLSGGVTNVEDEDVDWSSAQYSMTYSEAMQNLGFTKQRQTYVVKVHVSNLVVDGEVNEDCGSHNHFYFRLLFENGSSAYVLANQQLGADGFRTGATETFTIYTNQNYGRLTSINIIPEDISEDADSFDKLRISWIQVVRDDDSGFSTTWKAEVNEWISIDYHDEGERNSTTGQAGRTEAELCRPYLISSEGYSLNLLFALHTKGYTNTPFMGTVEGTIEYIDNEGNMETQDFNLVESIYAFANKPYTTATYSLSGKNVSAASIDRNWMLMSDHTDRFQIPINDIAQIVRMKLTLSSETSGYWNVSGVNVYQVKGDGKLILNQDSEYITTAELVAVSSSMSDTPYEQWYPANGAAQTMTIEFAPNDIHVDLSKNNWNSVITYEPQSKDDTLNIFAHVNKSSYPMDSYEMIAAANYQIEQVTETDQNGLEKTYADQQKQVSVSMVPDPENMMFTAIGVKATGITEFNSLTLRTRDELVQYTEIDYAYVEHVRSGVILDTYYLNFGCKNAENTITAVPEEDRQSGEQRQKLTFMLTEDSTTTALLAQTNDVAVSFTYTTKYDPTGQEYKSRNIFLAENQITRLKAGEVMSVEFTEEYVKDITGVTFTAMGTARNAASVKSAYFVTLNGENMENWYSFGTPMNTRMNLTPVSMVCTGSTSDSVTVQNATTVGDMNLQFTTAPASTMTESGTTTPIRMNIVYYDDNGDVRSMNIADIHDYLVDGTFNTDGVAQIRLLINGFREIRYLELEPYDNTQAYSSATWALSQITYQACVNDVNPVEMKRSVNQTVQEGKGVKVGMSQIVVRLVANILKDDGSFGDRRAYLSGMIDESETGILIRENQSIVLYPEISGSLDSVQISCVRVAVTQEGRTVTETDTESLSYTFTNGDISSALFTPKEVGDYRITVSSLEIGDVQVSVDVSVMEAVTENDDAESGDDSSEGSSETEDTVPEDEESAEPETIEQIIEAE